MPCRLEGTEPRVPSLVVGDVKKNRTELIKEIPSLINFLLYIYI